MRCEADQAKAVEITLKGASIGFALNWWATVYTLKKMVLESWTRRQGENVKRSKKEGRMSSRETRPISWMQENVSEQVKRREKKQRCSM